MVATTLPTAAGKSYLISQVNIQSKIAHFLHHTHLILFKLKENGIRDLNPTEADISKSEKNLQS